MNKKEICSKCNKNDSICENILFCNQCINNNLTPAICEQLMMFSIDTKNTLLCVCDANASKGCILQCCKKCCTVKNCTQHSEQTEKFNFNKCTLCNENDENLNIYCVKMKNKNQLVSYCAKCYVNYKHILNFLIFNNTTGAQRKKFNIAISENREEKKKRIQANEQIQEKMQIMRHREKIKKYKQVIQTLKNDMMDGPCDNILLKKYVNMINNDVIKVLNDKECFFKCVCDTLCSFNDVYHCEYCDLYKCADCTHSSIVTCEELLCDYPINLCKKSTFECMECVNNKINDFSKKNSNVKITSSLLNASSIEIEDFENNMCDNIFICGICNEDVNLTYLKISKCDTCQDYFCNGCGVFRKEVSMSFLYGSDSDSDSDSDFGEITFRCSNCETKTQNIKNESKNNKNNKNKNIKSTDQNNVIVIKTKPFVKYESDVTAGSKEDECSVCYTNKKTHACIPCGHLCLCYKCKSNVEDKCPICNEELYGIFKIYT
jgi:hypothetical protein